MDIFTIVRANIKAHIGQFIGIILMMCIAVTSILSFAGVIFSVGDSVEMCNELTKTADTTIIIPKVNVTDEMMDTLKSKDEFESVNAVDVLGIHNVKNSSNEKYVYHSQTFIMPDSGRYPLIKDDMSDFSSEKLSAKKGEIYFAAGLASEINVKPGEKVTLVCEASKLELTFAGYLEDPWGCSTMGWKHVIVSQEDFDSFVKEVHDEYDEYGISNEYDYWLMEFTLKDKSTSVSELNRIINEGTGLYDAASGSCSKQDSTQYSGMLVQVISGILVGVAVILFVVLLVVVTNNISSTIKTDYKNLGVLKSQGFSSSKLRKIYLFQFIAAELIGMVIGFTISFILLSVLLNRFAYVVGIVLKPSYNPILVAGSLGGILLISVLVIYICTSKISRVSPHKAISEGRDDISFSSRIQAPISKKMLSATVAFRNITSSVSQYVGIMITSLIMIVLLVSVYIGGQCISSKNTILTVDATGELSISNYNTLTKDEKDEIANIVASNAKIQDEFSIYNIYTSLNDTKVRTSVFDKGSNVQCVVSGRTPDYDNEVVVATGVINLFDVGIGDKVTITHNDSSYEYLIVGICNTTADMGNVVCMSEDAAKHIDLVDELMYSGHIFQLENPNNPSDWFPKDDAEKIANEITSKYNVKASAVDNDLMNSDVGLAMSFAGYVVYALTIIFVIIIVTMACTKCFNNERKQLGIYKAMGFTSNKLRVQFAFRFMIVFAIGAIIGLAVSGILVPVAFNALFGIMGVAKIRIDFVPMNYITPLVVICISAFIFAYIASRKVRKIDVNELIVE